MGSRRRATVPADLHHRGVRPRKPWLAMGEDVELWNMDECYVQQYETRTRIWVPPEVRDPVRPRNVNWRRR